MEILEFLNVDIQKDAMANRMASQRCVWLKFLSCQLECLKSSVA